VHIADALRERSPNIAMVRLSLMPEEFGGGTRIAASLDTFNVRYAKATLDSRSVVIVMSDGYDTDPPEALAVELRRLKRRVHRVIWLNPLLEGLRTGGARHGCRARLRRLLCGRPLAGEPGGARRRVRAALIEVRRSCRFSPQESEI
jgi:uncharacterized protein with von Willebrand factor type A (vWA) domain